MILSNYKNNVFVYDGQTKNIIDFLNGAEMELRRELYADIPRALDIMQDFIKKAEEKGLELEKGLEYRVFDLLAKYAINSGELRVLNICDACGKVYFQTVEAFKKELSGLPLAENLSVGLGRDSGKCYCCNCRAFDPQDGSRNLYIPIANRVKKDIDFLNEAGKKIGTAWVYWNKKKSFKKGAFFATQKNEEGRALKALLKRQWAVFRPINNESIIPGYSWRDVPAPDTSCHLDRVKYICAPRVLLAIFSNPEKITDKNEFFGDFVYCKKNELVEYSRIGNFTLEKDGQHIFYQGEKAYKKALEGYCYCQSCYSRAEIDDPFILREENADEIERTAFIGRGYTALCKNCVDRLKMDPYKIYQYSTKFNSVIPYSKQFCKKRFTTGRPVYYGVELEANTKGPRAEITRRILERLGGYVFAKYDGSLNSDTGVEFVSAPATFDKTREIWAGLFDVKYSRADSEDLSCKDLSAYADKRCGLHIHIDRTALRRADICHIVFFVNVFRSFCAKVAGRDYFKNEYTVCKDIPRPGRDSIYTAEECLRSYNGHYDAVNTRNDNTIEIRIFKANVTMQAFFRYLDFADALVMYSRSLKNLDFAKFTPADIMNFTAGKNRYKFLNDFFAKHKEFFKAQKIEGLKYKKELKDEK